MVFASRKSGGELSKNRLDCRDVQQPCPLLTRNVLFSLTDKTLMGHKGRSGKDTEYKLCKLSTRKAISGGTGGIGRT